MTGGFGYFGGSLAPSLEKLYFTNGLSARFQASTLAGSNGSSITSWAASVGNFTWTGGTPPALRTLTNSNFSNGRQAVRFTAASSQYLRCDALATLASGGAPFTVAAILRRNGTGDYNAVGFGRSSGTTITQIYLVNFTFAGLGSPNIYDTGPHPAAGAPPPTRTTEDALVIWQRNPNGTSRVWVNGQPLSFALPANTDAYQNACLGAVIFNGSPVNCANFDLADLCIWNRNLADRDIAAATLQMGAAGMCRWQVVGLGDSLTAGSATSGYSWFNAMFQASAWQSSHAYSLTNVVSNGGNLYECIVAGTSAGSGGPTGTGSSIPDGAGTLVWRYLNIALPSTCLGLATAYTAGSGINRAEAGRTLVAIGGSTSNEEDELSADILDIYDPYIPRVVFVFLGRNDLFYGATAAEAEASYWLIVDQIRAANPRDYIVAVTPLPGTDITTYWADFRQRVLDGWAAHADACWDVGGTPSLQDYDDTTYYNGDGIHLNIHGQSEALTTLPIATYQAAALSKMLVMMLHS